MEFLITTGERKTPPLRMCRNAGGRNTDDDCWDRLILLNHIAVGDVEYGEWSRSCNRNRNWNGNCGADSENASAHCGIHCVYSVYDVHMENGYGNVIDASGTFAIASYCVPGIFRHGRVCTGYEIRPVSLSYCLLSLSAKKPI